jgi:hypothetical protein
MSTLLQKLKSKGYWEFVIRPVIFKPDAIESFDECHRIIRENKVSLRGWDFPHYPSNSSECTNNVGFIECGTDWSYFVEYWRFYQSAQFVFLKGCWEDWHEQATGLFAPRLRIEPNTSISLLNIVYTTTEAYEFAARLAVRGVLGAKCVIEIFLHNCKNRRLVTLEPGRDLSGDYKCLVEKIPYTIEISSQKLIEESALLSRKAMHHIFQLFNWQTVGLDHFKQEQTKLLERRL